MKNTLFLAAVLFASPAAYAQETRIPRADQSAPADAAPAYAIRGNEVQTGSAVAFEPGTAAILPSSVRALNTVVKYLTDKSSVSRLRIEAHTVCGRGDQALSEARARAVASWLMDHGVECNRLVAAGFGCSKPIVADHAEMNERIEFINAELRGKLINGIPLDGGGKRVELDCL